MMAVERNLGDGVAIMIDPVDIVFPKALGDFFGEGFVPYARRTECVQLHESTAIFDYSILMKDAASVARAPPRL